MFSSNSFSKSAVVFPVFISKLKLTDKFKQKEPIEENWVGLHCWRSFVTTNEVIGTIVKWNKDSRLDTSIVSMLNFLNLVTVLWLSKRMPLFFRNTHQSI